MRPTHLHLLSGDIPNTAIKIELGPFGLPKFAGADEEVR
jgi:hypothetical protein